MKWIKQIEIASTDWHSNEP